MSGLTQQIKEERELPEAQIGGKPNCRTTEHLYVGAEHEMFSMALASVKGKVLRILEMLNKRTEFMVIGDDENRKFVKDYVGGQGTVYMCTSDSLTMPQTAWHADSSHPSQGSPAQVY